MTHDPHRSPDLLNDSTPALAAVLPDGVGRVL